VVNGTRSPLSVLSGYPGEQLKDRACWPNLCLFCMLHTTVEPHALTRPSPPTEDSVNLTLRKGLLALATTMAVAVGLVTTPALSSPSTQFTLFDATLTHRRDAYWQPTTTAPTNWVTPINYVNGIPYLRVQVIDKPSSLRVQANVCFWRSQYTVETCATKFFFSNEGTYWVKLQSPSAWWKKNGVFDWTVPFDVSRIMLKNASTGKLLMDRRCGASCYTGSDLAQHVPITLSAEMIVVARGARLNPPADWTGCPATWSTECPTPN
jgi:hypothetical protein